jgi:hydrogenase large subunit
LRTIHSFDPCIGCAVHIVDPDGKPLVQVNVSHGSGPMTMATCAVGSA